MGHGVGRVREEAGDDAGDNDGIFRQGASLMEAVEAGRLGSGDFGQPDAANGIGADCGRIQEVGSEDLKVAAVGRAPEESWSVDQAEASGVR
jgi:hypothetical protein